MEKNKLQGNELSFILLILICAFLYKIYPFLLFWYERLKLPFLLSFAILSLLSLGFIFYKFIKQPKEEKDLFLGFFGRKKVFVSDKQRTTHAQVIGTTGSGKTESVILPWIVQDIKRGQGVLVIDGKSDNSFLNKLYSYTVKFKREKDFKLFSLVHLKNSHSFNPLKANSSLEASERVFSAFHFENEYYRNIQYKIFFNLISLISEKTTPTFKLLHKLLTDKEDLSLWLKKCEDKKTKSILNAFLALSDKEREERTSGLESQLAHFAQSECHSLFDETENTFSMNEALEKGQILYFQLPTMLYPFLAQATGKLVLQSLQGAISRRHLSSQVNTLFSVYLDDFQDYIYEGFGSLLNKSRSANIAMIFSHQSLGDLERVSKSFSDVVLTNTNLKIIMRLTDPKTCDYFAKVFGTKSSVKETEQTDRGLLGANKTGRGSLRKVEEYIFHPNLFKKTPVGCGVVSLPDKNEVRHFKLSFPRLKNTEKRALPVIKNVHETTFSKLNFKKEEKKSPIRQYSEKRREVHEKL